MEHKGKVSFSRTMMQALEPLWLAKRHVSGHNDIESKDIKPVAIAIIKLCLSKGIC